MLERNELSFIFLWVINPVVILFYQNCASIPQEQARANLVNSTQIVHESTPRAPACKQGDCAEPIN